MQFAHELIVPEVGFSFKLFLFEGREGHYHREKHWHRSIEIFAVCDGELEFKIDEKTWHLTAGEFMIVNSNEVQLLEELYKTYCEKQCGYDMKMNSIFYHLLYLLVKEYRLTEVEDAFVRKNKNLNKLSAITSYMKENYAQELSLEEVARIFGYSPTYLSRMFQKYAGITYKSYLQNIRLEYAMKDLKGGKYNITETALRSGFSGSKAMARAFRKKYGILPSEYKENG